MRFWLRLHRLALAYAVLMAALIVATRFATG